MRWNAQSSGTTIPANVARALEGVWSELLEGLLAKPTITPGSAKLYEGTAYAVTLTRYERNRRARRECIAYYGASCFLCEHGVDSLSEYLQISEDYSGQGGRESTIPGAR